MYVEEERKRERERVLKNYKINDNISPEVSVGSPDLDGAEQL